MKKGGVGGANTQILFQNKVDMKLWKMILILNL